MPASLRISAFHSAGAIGKPIPQHLSALAAASGFGGLEHARRMLGLIIRCGQRLVAPYVPVLIRALLPHAWGHDDPLAYLRGGLHGGGDKPPAVVVFTPSLLAALGELSAVAPDALLPYIPMLLPQFVDAVLQVCGDTCRGDCLDYFIALLPHAGTRLAWIPLIEWLWRDY